MHHEDKKRSRPEWDTSDFAFVGAMLAHGPAYAWDESADILRMAFARIVGHCGRSFPDAAPKGRSVAIHASGTVRAHG